MFEGCQLRMLAIGTLSHSLIISAALVVASAIYGNDISLVAALILTCFLFMGNDAFYIVQQTNVVEFAPLPRLKFKLLLCERMGADCATIVALLFTVTTWDAFGDDAILVFSVLWIASNLMMYLILWIYKVDPKDDLKRPLLSAA